MKRLAPYAILLTSIAVGVAVFNAHPTPTTFAIAAALIVGGHIAPVLTRARIEGAPRDERLEQVSQKAKAQGFDTLLTLTGAYLILSLMLKWTGRTPPHQSLEPGQLLGLYVALALVLYALSYALNARRTGGL